MTDQTLLLCDVSYQVHRAVHANPGLTCGGTFTGGLYGFFQILGKAVRETEATQAAFCLDWPPYVRNVDYPQYKLARKKDADPVIQERVAVTKGLVSDALSAIGLNVYGVCGFESDDLIAGMALRYRHRFTRIYAQSNDSDLWQLLWMQNLALYKDDIKKCADHSTLTEMGITPDEYMLATALAGTHNCVDGIPRVGMTTALKIVKDAPSLRRVQGVNETLVARNLSLIKLPHAKLPRGATRIDPPREFDPRRLYRALGRYDIDVTDAMVKACARVTR